MYHVVPVALLLAHRGDPGVARDAACGAAVPVRRAVLVRSPLTLRPWPPGRWSRPRRRGRCAGTPTGCRAAAWWGGAVLGDLVRPRGGRRASHIVALFLFLAAALLLWAPRSPASSRRPGLVLDNSAGRAGGGPAAACDRGAGRAGDQRAARLARTPPADTVVWEGPEPEPFVPEPDQAGVEEEEPPRLAEDRRRGRASPVRRPISRRRAYRPSVTDSPDFEWTVPDAARPEALVGGGGAADTAGQEKIAAQLIEALGHFGVEARVIGKVAGPHHALRAAARAGHRGRKVAQLKDDLAYARGDRTSASWRRSRASRRSASRSRTRAGGSSTSATSSKRRRPTGRR